MEALLMAAAPNHFLEIQTQWICGFAKFILLKCNLIKEQGVRSKQLNPSSTDLPQHPSERRRLRSARSPKEQELCKSHTLWHKLTYSCVVWPGCHFGYKELSYCQYCMSFNMRVRLQHSCQQPRDESGIQHIQAQLLKPWVFRMFHRKYKQDISNMDIKSQILLRCLSKMKNK